MASLLATDLLLIQRGGVSYKMTGADLAASVQTPGQGSVTLTLAGDLSGSVTLDGSASVTLTAAVADGSHNHLISNIDGLDVELSAKAPLASPSFTGTPTAPTAATATNTNQLATTAYVTSKLAASDFAPLASPTFTGTPAAPTPTAGTNTTQLATTAFVATALGGYASLSAPQSFTAQQTFTELKETTFTLASSGTIALDPANGSIQRSVLSGAPTFTDSLEAGQTVVLMLENGASYTVNWPAITWVSRSGNAAPALTAKDTVVLWKVNTALYGAYVGSYA